MIKDIAPLPGYPEPYGLLCAALQDATRDWRAELPGNLGASVLNWRVRPGAQSIGAVLLHMMQVEVFWLEMFVLGKRPEEEEAKMLMFGQIDVDEGVWPEVHEKPIEWYFELHDQIRARTLEAIKSWPAPDTLLDREGEDWKYTPRWVLSHVVQHESYHGGQIVLLHDLFVKSSS